MLVAEQATYRYGDGPPLGPFSITARAGEIVAVLGPNGAGKTTCLHLLAGRYMPNSGAVTWLGRPLADLHPAERARLVAVVPQRLALAFDLPVETLVELGRLHALPPWARLGPLPPRDREQVDMSLKVMDLGDLRHRSYRSLSGGEQQRVLLAMALAQDAPVLLLDEPTAALDPGHARAFLDLVRQLADQRGRAVVMTHHDVSLAAQYADHLVLLSDGRPVAAGRPEAVLTEPVLSAVYRTPLGVLAHPETGRPLVYHRVLEP
jgi:iron complex transport system ATP-binding protein